MIEDKATEKLKKRLKDMGLIVNASADKAKSPKSVGTEKRATSPKSASNGNSSSKKRGKK